MARRKVSVELELEAARYLATSRQITTATKVSEEAIEDLGDEADETGRDLDQLAANATVAARRIDNVGDQSLQTAAALAVLDARINDTRRSIRDLGLELARAPGDTELTERLGGERSTLRRLAHLRRELTPDVEQDMVTRLGQNIGALPSKLRGTAYLSIGVFAAAAAPLLSGVISAAVVGAIGAGGVVGGAILAAQDSRVANAWKKLGGDLLGQLTEASSGFVHPLEDAAKTFSDAFRAGDLTGVLRESALLVDPIAEAVAGFVRDLGPGLQASVRGSLPVWHMLATELPETGAAIGDMVTSMADTSSSAMLAFNDFFDAVQVGTRSTGDLLAGLSEIYALTRNPVLAATFERVPIFGLTEVIGKAAPKLRELTGTTRGYMFAVDHAATKINLLNSGEKMNIAAAKELEKSRRDATKAMQDYNRAVDQGISNAATLDAAEDALKLGMLDLNQSVKDNGKVWNDNTREGLANRAALANVIDTIDRIRRAQIDSGIDAQTANAAYNDQIAVLEALGTKLGLTKDQINDLIGDKYINIIATFTTRDQRKHLPSGDFRVSGGGRLLEADINLDVSRRVAGGVIQRQHGGPMVTGQSYIINEGRPEVVTLASGTSGYVHPSVGAWAAWQASKGGGDITYNINLTAYSDRFNLKQVQDDLALRGVH